MKYERLTTRNEVGKPISVLCEHCHIQDKCDFSKETCCNELADRLAELEDKIESGKMIELLCKVGERIYYIDEYIAEFDRVDEYTVEKIEIVKDQIRIWFGDNIGYALAENFGKEVFTDKSQAEARLKELQGE